MTYDDRRERERSERRQYEADVYYEVWSSGRDPDRINLDRVDYNRWAGMSADEAAIVEIQAQQPTPNDAEFDDGCLQQPEEC